MADYGIKVMQPGKSISSTEPTDYVFSSKFTAVKIAVIFSGSISLPHNAYTMLTVAHGLAFIPVVLFWTDLSGLGKFFSGVTHIGDGSTIDTDQGTVFVSDANDANNNPNETWVDATNVNITYRNDVFFTQTVAYKIVCFGDSGS